uniref:CCHC-type domain-containing protein n=1 Tax=Panagrolaimus sp. PS1159 TaxID=55785 RepID=A0AC35FAI6_9BILA
MDVIMSKVFDAGGREFIISQVLQIVGVAIIAYTIAFKLHRKLASLKNVLSPATLKARKQFFIALLLQFTIPSAFLVGPPVTALTLILFEYENAHLLSNYIMPIIALHSAFNALIVMFVITPYRLTLIRWFRYIFRIKQNPVIGLQPSLLSTSLTQHIEGQPKSKPKNATTDDQQHNKNEPKEKPKQPCFFCDGDHWSNECPKYRTAEERIKITKDNKRCLSCLKPGHFTSKCEKQRNCYHCKKRGHHKHLCYSKYPSSTPRNTKTNTVSNSSRSESPPKCTAPSPVPVTTTAAAIREGDTVLPILEIPVENPKNREFHTVPALMDSGSMLSYITDECAKRLNLPVINHELLNIETFNCTVPLIKNTPIYSLLVQYKNVQYKNGEQENIYLRGVENITKQLTMACMNRLKTVNFKVVIPDILIGSDYFFKYFKCKTLPSGYYHANTPFGPVVCGKGPKLTTTNTVTLTVPSKSLDAMERLEKKVEFQWKYESVGIFDDPKTPEREIVEKFFEETYRIDEDGRYVVKLPWKSANPKLNDHRG